MNYHDITKDDMKNGTGLRVVLWLAGCDHHCKNCQNKITWDPNDGLPFTPEVFNEIIEKLKPNYISGLTLSGGDPFFISNRLEVFSIIKRVKEIYPKKSIWLYTGYTWESIIESGQFPIEYVKMIDVIVDGPFIEELADVKYPWAGSTNQRVINVKKSLKEGEAVLWEHH